MTEISYAKVSGIFMHGDDNYLRGTLDIGKKDSDLTVRYASLSSIEEESVVKGVFKGYSSKGDQTGVGACVVSGKGAALKFLGNKSFVSVIKDSVTIESPVIDLKGQVKLNDNVYINGSTLESYIQNIVSKMLP